MARTYAQLCTLVFFVAGFGGLLLGNAFHLVNGMATGNLGNLTLHMTYVRDVVDIVLFLLFVYAGFFASRATGKYVVLGVGLFLVFLGVLGFVHGDTPTASICILNMNFPTIVNVFDTFFGVVGILAAVGTLSDDDISRHENRSFLRES